MGEKLNFWVVGGDARQAALAGAHIWEVQAGIWRGRPWRPARTQE